MYIDLYLSKEKTKITDFKAVGITALHMAVKIEEVELIALGRMANKAEIRQVLKLERTILKALDYRLLPDTLNFWLESVIKFWDHFAANKKPNALPLFFKTAVRYVGSDTQMILSPIILEKDNMFRRAM